MSLSILLAVVLGAGAVPVPDSTIRFPDASSWSGTQKRRVENMLAEIRETQGGKLATSGPGPQQLAARWQNDQLNAAERVAVLLGAPVFHHPAVLPMYAGALRSPVLRERQAAVVGLAWTLGVAPPDPTTIDDASPVVQAAIRMAEALQFLTRDRTFVELWSESYLVARGLLNREGRMVLSPDPSVCLNAIREIARPEDLDAIAALWPAVVRADRPSVLKTIEIVTMQQFYQPPRDPQAPTGGWLYTQAEAQLDTWVGGMCRPIDGLGLALANIARAWPLEDPPQRPYQLLLTALEGSYEPLWILPSELLLAYGARGVDYDRLRLDNPRNRDLRNRVRDSFAVSKEELKTARHPGHQQVPSQSVPSPPPRRVPPRPPRRR